MHKNGQRVVGKWCGTEEARMQLKTEEEEERRRRSEEE